MPGWSVGGTSSVLTAGLLQPAPSWVSCSVFCSQDSSVERTSWAWLARCLLMDGVIGSGPFLWVSLPSLGQEALTALPPCSPQHLFKYRATYKYTSSWALLMTLSFPKMSLQTTFPSCDCENEPNDLQCYWNMFAFLYTNRELQIIFGSLVLAHSSKVTTECRWSRWQLYNNSQIQADQARVSRVTSSVQKERCCYMEIINWSYLPRCTLQTAIR